MTKYLDLLENWNSDSIKRLPFSGDGYYIRIKDKIVSERFDNTDSALAWYSMVDKSMYKGSKLMHESDHLTEGIVEVEIIAEGVLDHAVEMTVRLNKDKAAGKGPKESKVYAEYLRNKHGVAHSTAVYKTAQKLMKKD